MNAAALGRLRALDRAALAARFRAGTGVAPSTLGDKRFRGVVLGLPAIVERATWTLFAKDVIDDDAGGLLGWNVRLARPPARDPQTLATTPLVARRDGRGRPALFAPFVVTEAASVAVVDYRAASQPPSTALLARTFDPLVQVDVDDAGRPVLLGVTMLVLRGRAVPTPTWFALLPAGPVPADARAYGRELVRPRQ